MHMFAIGKNLLNFYLQMTLPKFIKLKILILFKNLFKFNKLTQLMLFFYQIVTMIFLSNIFVI